MHISWYGQSCFKITSTQTALVTDPPSPATGVHLPKTPADILVLSRRSEPKRSHTESVGGSPFIIDGPGEFEVKGIFVYGIPHDEAEGSTLFLFKVEQMSIAFLDGLNRDLEQKELELFETVDILIVPIGGKDMLNGKKAADVISQIEPRIVIPMNYKIPGLKEPLDIQQAFSKEMGQTEQESIDKLKIARSGLPQEKLQIVFLNPQK